ncbi:MAG: ECF-type sigma factor [Gemmataceae bacterium]|nr:ECF-type sigma factor [Gemmataceae bacterium]
MSDVIQLLQAIANGGPQAASERLLVVYDELRKLAAQRLRQGVFRLRLVGLAIAIILMEQPGQLLALLGLDQARVEERRAVLADGKSARPAPHPFSAGTGARPRAWSCPISTGWSAG